MIDEPKASTGDRVVRSSLSRIERDLEHLVTKLDSFISTHQLKHDAEQSAFHAQLLQAAPMAQTVARLDAQVTAIDGRIDTIDVWRHEILGATRLMRLAFGTSILSAVAALVGIAVVVARA